MEPSRFAVVFSRAWGGNVDNVVCAPVVKIRYFAFPLFIVLAVFLCLARVYDNVDTDRKKPGLARLRSCGKFGHHGSHFLSPLLFHFRVFLKPLVNARIHPISGGLAFFIQVAGVWKDPPECFKAV